VDFHAAVGRAAAQQGHQIGQELAVQIIRRGHVEGARLFLWHERCLLQEKVLGFVENALCWCKQAFTMLGRHHAARAAHQQRIAGQLAQLAQRSGDGGCG
jgi:hypothetical protein